MTIRNTNSAETWDKVYQAFEQVNFSAYDYDSIKQSLLDYLRIYYAETFNDMIESDELISILEMFAYVAEQLAYRVDMLSHENFIDTAQRKQSILRLIKMISYKATRNVPIRGLVKINSISTTENVSDGRGIDLSKSTIYWNDANNANWREQFILIMNRVMTTRFGQFQKTEKVEDVVFDSYALKNNLSSFPNGVFSFTASTGIDSYPMEVVPSDVDSNGPFEREPDLFNQFSILYANDGIGDGSDYTGFLMTVKQGTLLNIEYYIAQRLPNRKIDFLPKNINNIDVWVHQIDSEGKIIQRWVEIDSLGEQNLVFNDKRDTKLKYEVDTLENDQVSIIFGDGDFSEAPLGKFRFWLRQSANKSIVISKNKIVNQKMSFNYVGLNGNTETCSISFSLTSTLQNGAPSETIEHIRQSAPSTYYSQNRMVNGQDYNTFPLKDSTIIKLKTINRTFAGQPKHVDWNDASGNYENVKIFGDDLTIKYAQTIDTQTTTVSGQSLIDSIIEPLLKTSGVVNNILHLSATDPVTMGVVSPPRRFFIEDNRANTYSCAVEVNGVYENRKIQISKSFSADGSLKEKTAIQGLIDRHWYGDPIEYVQSPNGEIYAKIPDPAENPKDDSKIYATNIPRTIDGVNRFPPGDKGSELQRIAQQPFFALRYNRYFNGIGDGAIAIHNRPQGSPTLGTAEVWTLEIAADGQTINVRSNLRGTFPPAVIGADYYITPDGFNTSVKFFTITSSPTTLLEPGDAFILDTPFVGLPIQRTGTGFNSSGIINLYGWWEILESDVLETYYSGGYVGDGDENLFTMGESNKKHSWLIFIRKITQSSNDLVIGYDVHNRNLKLLVESPTTKFWFNEVDQILDLDTYKKVYDNIKILRSNLDSSGAVLKENQRYDVVGAIKDDYGVVDFTKLEVVPSDLLQETSSGDLVPDRLLQFENFSKNSYHYFTLDNPKLILTGGDITLAEAATWSNGAFVDDSLQYGRTQAMPTNNNGLDFMWQHFSPFTNIIDPSPTNINDAYVITRSYYDSLVYYIRGLVPSAPTAPTSFQLKNDYADILDNKMLSDTVIMHSGKFKLLFGGLAEPQLRAKFKVVKSPTSSLSNERIKEEILAVIDKYFEIENWDFGESFHATELIGLIHQRLPVDISTVIIVPQYSTNSFGDLFTVDCGFDEILTSCARLSDIEMVDALTNTVMRKK